MVGRTERPLGDQGHFRCQKTHNRINLTDLQGLLPGHIRQNGRQPLTKHTLTGTGRADQQHIVAACGGNLQGPLHILLAQHILKVSDGIGSPLRNPERLLFELDLSVKSRCQLLHIPDAVNRRAPGKGSFRRVFHRDKQSLNAFPLRCQGHRQDTGNRPKLSVKTHFS